MFKSIVRVKLLFTSRSIELYRNNLTNFSFVRSIKPTAVLCLCQIKSIVRVKLLFTSRSLELHRNNLTNFSFDRSINLTAVSCLYKLLLDKRSYALGRRNFDVGATQPRCWGDTTPMLGRRNFGWGDITWGDKAMGRHNLTPCGIISRCLLSAAYPTAIRKVTHRHQEKRFLSLTFLKRL